MAKQGRVQNLEMTARYDDGESVILDPVTFKSTASYVALSQLQADTYFSVSFMFKTLGPNGLILFNGISDYDFLALELHNGYLYYSYDVGGGPQRIYVNTAEPLNDNKWHDVSLIRPMKEKQIIRVDHFPATVENMDRNSPTDFNLKGPLYLGGVEKTMYRSLPANIKSGHGFQGCIATLYINGHKYNILRDAKNVEYSVTVGCKESGISCQPSSCFNGGHCVQQWNSYACDCEMTSYTGPTCNDVSTTYRFALGKGLITFEHGEGKDVSTNSDYLAFGFKTIQHNANLVRVDSSSGDDYIEMQLAGGNLVVAYNMGKLEHPIGEFYHKVNDGAYHVVRFTRSGPNATLQIDTWPQQTKTPAGDQMSVFNNQARVWIGGRKDSRGQINNGFIGTMSGFVFNSHHVFDMLVNRDPQVTKEGDVTLLPHNKSKMENDPEAMQSTQGIKHHLDKRSNRKEESSIRNIFSQVPTKASYSNNPSGRRKSGKWQDDNSIKKIGKKSSDKYLNGHFVQNNANTKLHSTHDIVETTVLSTTSQRNYILEGSLDVLESNLDQSEIDNRDTVQEHSGYPLDGSGFMETGYHDMENYMTGKTRDQSAKASRHSRLSPEWAKLKQVQEYYDIKNENIPQSRKILLGTFQNSPLAIDLRDTSKNSKFPKDRGKGWKKDYKIQQPKHSSTTPNQLTSDDIISSSGMEPECLNQEEDECISEALAPTDEIITASIIVHRTTTLRPDLNKYVQKALLSAFIIKQMKT
ncbi:hypothetical protein ACJMK2_036072 [Sinanodonta woodiana]|uniref:Neurexin n=1 Tax=Sinanodonta woodiana TaxID=1069815 RepID=A0ABD3WHR5_SINWO